MSGQYASYLNAFLFCVISDDGLRSSRDFWQQKLVSQSILSLVYACGVGTSFVHFEKKNGIEFILDLLVCNSFYLYI